jgi:hypothetical protein
VGGVQGWGGLFISKKENIEYYAKRSITKNIGGKEIYESGTKSP